MFYKLCAFKLRHAGENRPIALQRMKTGCCIDCVYFHVSGSKYVVHSIDELCDSTIPFVLVDPLISEPPD